MAKAKEKLKAGSPIKSNSNPLKTALAKITKPGKTRSPVKKPAATTTSSDKRKRPSNATKSATKKKSPDPKKFIAKALAKVSSKKSPVNAKKSDGSAGSGKKSPAKPTKSSDVGKGSKPSDTEVKEKKELKTEQKVVVTQDAKSPKTKQSSVNAKTEVKDESTGPETSDSNDSKMVNKNTKADKGSPFKTSISSPKNNPPVSPPKPTTENITATPKKNMKPDIVDSVKSSPRKANLKQSPKSSPVKAMPSSPGRNAARDSPIKKPKLVKIRNVKDQDDVKEIKPVIKRRGSKSGAGLKSPTQSPAFDNKKSAKTSKEEKSNSEQNDLPAKKEIKSEDACSKDTTKSEKSNSEKVGRLRTPKKLSTDIYKSRHNIGRRSAGRVCSYKETEIALLFPDDYQWSVSKIKAGKVTRKDSIDSDKTESDQSEDSSGDSDDDSEVTFPKIEKSPKQTTKSQSASPASRASKQTESKPKPATKPSNKSQPKAKAKGTDKAVYDFESEKEETVKTKQTSPSKKKTAASQVESNEEYESSDSSSDDESDEKTKPKLGKSQKTGKSPTKAKVAAPKRRKSKYTDIRPRAPRIQRTACLNANAINSLLYDTRGPEKPAKIVEKPATKSKEDEEGSSTQKSKPASKPQTKKEKASKEKEEKKEEKKETAKPKKKKAVKRKPDEPEVSLWPPPKRMASLNAQAIMAACKELEDFKPEKIPKPPKDTTPKKKKVPTATLR